MLQRVQTKLIRTEPVSEFSPEVQRALAAVGQHIDFLLARTHTPYLHKGHNGSDAWILGDPNDDKVVLKTFPWDQRLRKELDLPPSSKEGIGVLVRDEFLRPSDMRCLWNAFGKAYRPSPSFPLYAVRPQEKMPFQLLLWTLGNTCNVFALPGVVESEIEGRLALRSYSGRTIAQVDSADPSERTADPSQSDGEADVDPDLMAALKALVQRAQLSPG